MLLSAPVVTTVFRLHVAVHAPFGTKPSAERAENAFASRLVAFRSGTLLDVSSFNPDVALLAEDAGVLVASQILRRRVPFLALVTDVL